MTQPAKRYAPLGANGEPLRGGWVGNRQCKARDPLGRTGGRGARFTLPPKEAPPHCQRSRWRRMGVPLWGFLEGGGASEGGVQRGTPRRGRSGTVFAPGGANLVSSRARCRRTEGAEARAREKVVLVLFPRMALRVDFFQIGDAHREVDLGGGEGGVAEKLLDMADIGLVPEHQRCAGVAERVRRDALPDPRLGRILFTISPDHSLREPVPLRDRKRWCRAGRGCSKGRIADVVVFT